jgi:hypothetical protein
VEDDKAAIKHELLASIEEELRRAEAAAPPHAKLLERYDPQKAATILFLHAQGKSQTCLCKKYGYDRSTVIRIITTYADQLGKWRELGGKLASYSYLNITSLEEDMIESVREGMDSGELKPTFKDIKDISIAKANSSREAMLARGEATSISREEKVWTDDDYKKLMEQARKQMANEAIPVDICEKQ